ncbi:MAG TPA: LPS export ABC transporter periplasmic protein LptC [Stellaceae bacterium]|nr:LPS export ABC transporter periplasmic protein LptC [Stellaceae bacterium]
MSATLDLAALKPSPRVRRRVRRGYSRLVSLMKLMLPAIAGALLLLIIAWPHFESIHITLPRIDLREARELRMVMARYAGIDRQNRPFVLNAEVVRQAPRSDDLVSLEIPHATLTTEGGGWVTLTSKTGIYQPQAQLLDLFGNVEIHQDKGNSLYTETAHADMAAGTAEGHERVSGDGPAGWITAEGFKIIDHGDTIIFTGRAQLQVRPQKPGVP